MKRLNLTLATLIASLGLTVSAQAAVMKSTTNTKTVEKKAVAKKAVSDKDAKKEVKGKKAGKKGNEINMDIPADIKIDEKNAVNPRPYAVTPDVQPATAVVVPVTSTQVTQTAPAVETVTVTPINKNTVQKTITTSVPVQIDTVTVPAVVVNP
ncbi:MULTISPECIES: hypothetical protein [unclassified Moraxella]|uniref:hypothetical protein n=1 Tax=unclassified Moraxella TaxID=2685852 RepID=UPI003AF4E37E